MIVSQKDGFYMKTILNMYSFQIDIDFIVSV